MRSWNFFFLLKKTNNLNYKPIAMRSFMQYDTHMVLENIQGKTAWLDECLKIYFSI